MFTGAGIFSGLKKLKVSSKKDFLSKIKKKSGKKNGKRKTMRFLDCLKFEKKFFLKKIGNKNNKCCLKEKKKEKERNDGVFFFFCQKNKKRRKKKKIIGSRYICSKI
jgi:hypothetical protein